MNNKHSGQLETSSLAMSKKKKSRIILQILQQKVSTWEFSCPAQSMLLTDALIVLEEIMCSFPPTGVSCTHFGAKDTQHITHSN